MSSEASGFRVEVVSPERVLYSGEATQVITRTLGGGEIASLGFLHQRANPVSLQPL